MWRQGLIACVFLRWRRTFQAYDVKMMWLTTRLTILRHKLTIITDSHVFLCSMIHWNVHVLIALTAQSVLFFPRHCLRDSNWALHVQFISERAYQLLYILFIFDRHKAKKQVVAFFHRHTVYASPHWWVHNSTGGWGRVQGDLFAWPKGSGITGKHLKRKMRL